MAAIQDNDMYLIGGIIGSFSSKGLMNECTSVQVYKCTRVE